MPLQCIVFSGLLCSQHAIEMDLVSPKAPKNPDSSPISVSLKIKKLFKFFLHPTQPEQTIVIVLLVEITFINCGCMNTELWYEPIAVQ